jgi:hypothetical protein
VIQNIKKVAVIGFEPTTNEINRDVGMFLGVN